MSHAPLSPSAAHRWITCPASALATERSPDSEASLEGTAAHALSAMLLGSRNRDALMARKYLDADPAWSAHVKSYVSYVQSIAGKKYIETLLPALPGFPEVYGTADAIIWHAGNHELTIVDLKFGRQKVTALGNPQLLIYAVLAMNMLGVVARRTNLVIFQPRIGNVGKWSDSGRNLVKQFTTTVVPAVRGCRSSAPVYRPSVAACKWCPARATCSARAETNSETFEQWSEGK